ncbi:hypothetical protein QV09_06960, partial [Gallibacterium salpingitidis]
MTYNQPITNDQENPITDTGKIIAEQGIFWWLSGSYPNIEIRANKQITIKQGINRYNAGNPPKEGTITIESKEESIDLDFIYSDGPMSIVLQAENAITLNNNSGQESYNIRMHNNASNVIMTSGSNTISLEAPNKKDQNIIIAHTAPQDSIDKKTVELHATKNDNVLILKATNTNINDGVQRAMDVYNGGSVLLKADNGQNKIQIGDAKNSSNVNGNVSTIDGILSNGTGEKGSATVEMISAKGNEISIYAPNAKDRRILSAFGKSVINDKTSIVLTATDDNANNVLILQTTATNQDGGNLAGIKAKTMATVSLSAAKGQNILLIGNDEETDLNGKVLGVYGINNGTDNPNKVNDELGGNVQIDADKGNIISIYAPNAKERTIIKTWNGNTTLQTKDGNNELILQTTETNQQNGIHRAIDSFYGSLVSLKADNGLNKIHIGDAQNFSNVNGIVSKVEGIFSNNAATSMEAGNGNEISIYAPNAKERHIIETWAVANIKLQTKEGNNELKLQTTSTYQDDGVQSAIYSNYDYDGLGLIVLAAENGQNQIQIGNNQETNIIGKVADVYGIDNRSGTAVEMEAGKGNIISIYAPNAKKRTVIKTWNGNTILQTKDGNNELILQTTATNQDSVLNDNNDNGIHRAIDVYSGGSVLLQADNGQNKIQIGDVQNFSNVKGIVSKVEGIFSNNAATSMEAGNGNEILIYAPNAQVQNIINTQEQGGKTELLAKSGSNNLMITSDLGENREFELVWGSQQGKVNLKAAQDNIIQYNGKLNVAIPTTQEELDKNSTYIRGLYAWARGEVNLEAQNNRILIQGDDGDGLGVGYKPISENNEYDFYTHGLFASNVKEEGYKPEDEGISKISLTASNGNNVVGIKIRSHGEINGIEAQHQGEITLSATGENQIYVINPEPDTRLMDLHSKERVDDMDVPVGGDRTYRMGVYSSADSKVVLQAAKNFIEIGGNPLLQTAIGVDGNATADIIADNGTNTVTVNNAVFGSTGLSVLRSTIYSKIETPNTTLNLTALQGTNFIQMNGDEADLALVEQSDVLKKTNVYQAKVGVVGILATSKGSAVTLNAKQNVIVHNVPTESPFSNINIYAADEAQVKLIGTESNTLTGAKIAIQSFNKAKVTIDGQMT